MTAHRDANLSDGRSHWLELALVMAIFFIQGGAPAPHVNESHYLAKARHYWDPSYCPGDFFLDSKDAHLVFYWTLGWLTQWLPMSAAAWLGRLAAWALLAVGWTRLVRSITSAPGAAALSAAVWVALVDRANFAGEWAVGGVEAKCFAYGLVLLGLADIARGNWRTPWLWFGAASAFHVLVGGWAVLAALGAWLAEPSDRRPSLRSILGFLLVGGVLSLPGLVPALLLDRGVPAETVREAARIYVFERLPHHLAPLSLPAAEVRARFLRFGLLCLGLVALWNATRRRTQGDATTPWRAESLLRVIHFAVFAWLFAVVGLFLEWLLADQPTRAAGLLRFYWFRLADVAVPLAMALGGAALVAAVRRRADRVLTACLAIVAVLGAAHLFAMAGARWLRPWPPATAKTDDFPSWRDACQWIRDHAPADAVCIVPRPGQSFKWFAERADVVNWKDIPQNAAGLVQWRRRMSDLYEIGQDALGQAQLINSPEDWGARRVREVAAKYGARYVIARIDPPLALRRVYPPGPIAPTDWYAVYDLDPAPPEPSE